MDMRLSDRKAEMLDKVATMMRDRLSAAKAEPAERFMRTFYANVAPDDIIDEEVENLFGACLSLWSFAQERTPGEPKIRAFNPSYEANGWKSVHTVVEIVNDDMPFLVDSVTAELNRRDLTVHLVIHPIAFVKRGAAGKLGELRDNRSDDGTITRESMMHVEISEQTSEDALSAIVDGLREVLDDVRVSVADWPKMRQKVIEIIDRLRGANPPVDRDELDEDIGFLEWMVDDRFTLLGYRDIDYAGSGRKRHLEVVQDSGLGLLRDPEQHIFEGISMFETLPDDVLTFIEAPRLVQILKASERSTVHRPAFLDVITVKRYDAKGRIVGQHQIAGLLTSVAYNQRPSEIPLLRRKVARVIERTGLEKASHDRKALTHILETYPRDELFQIDEDELTRIATGILQLQERQRISIFARVDAFERFVTVLVFLPRDQYTTTVRKRIEAVVGSAFNGRVSGFQARLEETVLVRLQFTVLTERGRIPDVDLKEVEQRLVEETRSWGDKLQQALIEEEGEARGLSLYRRYGDAFPTAYTETFSPQAAIYDVGLIEDVLEGNDLAINFYRAIEGEENEVRLKVLRQGEPVALSDILPMLENMGVRVVGENPFVVEPRDAGTRVWVHDFFLRTSDGRPVDLPRVREKVQAAFLAVWHGEIEDDGFNRLVLTAGIDMRESVILRAYAKFLRQAAFTFSQAYIEETLAKYPRITAWLVELFLVRSGLDVVDRDARQETMTEKIVSALDAVDSLDDDRILRRYLNLIQSTLRTNYFQTGPDGRPKPYLSLKLDSRSVEELPLPRPLYEVFVYSPRTEGLHLRGGKVARGGIRWSDRREDFRTEILGLMKAQMVKNSVIVPVGSKGGFVLKRPPREGGREALQAEGIACYKILMRGLLDLTDNLDGGEVVPPPQVVRHDDDDPYLVVAADKGTATFSDIANGVSQEYGFWLDDAFASGGSAGYDHKKMGITARGAWESVKRHFREFGVDTQTTDFTVVGCGDMSGDVFGNGMLLSSHIRLLGAFNHLHIFVDPEPDPARSFEERQRLFDKPRSSWNDYDPALISEGGGVFDRKSKSITLTPQICKRFRIDRKTVTPNDLIRAMLGADIDLLWFGGIGTYVKSVEESNGDIGDRGNDPVRVDGCDLRCRVVGEGANLGVTQLGRIEFARKGGRINTDAIDNSAGVDCSDHEVNIKILLGAVVSRGDLTEKQRNDLLGKMTEDVAALVLRDNYQQTQALTVSETRAPRIADMHMRLMRRLERLGRLDRDIEFLPDDETLADRAKAGGSLTRPELSVLLSYAKMSLYDELLDSDLPDEAHLQDDLERYFPPALIERYRDTIHGHRLRREIICTYVTNSLVNRAGETFVSELVERTGMGPVDIARGYLAAREVFQIRRTWDAIESLDNAVPADAQAAMLIETHRLVERSSLWFLRHYTQPLAIAETVAAYRDGIADLRRCLDDVLSPAEQTALEERAARFRAMGVGDDLAREIASFELALSGCDIVCLAQGTRPIPDVARMYFGVGARLGFDWLRDVADRVPAETHWQKLAVQAITDDFYAHQVKIVENVIEAAGSHQGDPDRAFEAWADSRRSNVDRTIGLINELRSAAQPDIAILAVANGQLRTLVQA